MVTYGLSTLYPSFDKRNKDRLSMRIPEAIEATTKKTIPKYKRFIPLGVTGNNEKGVDCIVPDIKYEI
jgi:hypothetical protein